MKFPKINSRRVYSVKTLILDYIIIIFGAMIYATSVVIFTSPNNIAPGGLTGISTMLNFLFSFPIGRKKTHLDTTV